jgi:hypothetical protein
MLPDRTAGVQYNDITTTTSVWYVVTNMYRMAYRVSVARKVHSQTPAASAMWLHPNALFPAVPRFASCAPHVLSGSHRTAAEQEARGTQARTR